MGVGEGRWRRDDIEKKEKIIYIYIYIITNKNKIIYKIIKTNN